MNAEQLAAGQQELRTCQSTVVGLKNRIKLSQEEIDAMERRIAVLRPEVEAAESAAVQAAADAAKKARK